MLNIGHINRQLLMGGGHLREVGIIVDCKQSLFCLKICEGEQYVSIQAVKPWAGSFANTSGNETRAVSLLTCTGTCKTAFEYSHITTPTDNFLSKRETAPTLVLMGFSSKN